ncbi:MAG: sulfatase [Chloroflexi bacterium]|nr:sulfatase [Chloroflexota bacterium]MCH8235322.1 sulfatase [Chloroflexota bacterium]
MNVIVLMNDTFRRDHMGAYGNDWIRTPNLDRLASESAVFDRAYIASYPTIPNRWDLATGRYGFPIRGWEPLDPDDVTLAQVLSAAGYTTQLIYDPPQIGYHNFDYTRGFDAWSWVRGQHTDPYVTDPTVPTPLRADYYKIKSPDALKLYWRNQGLQKYDRDYTVSRIAGEACDWIEANATLDRFFLWVDMWDPHEPFDAPWYDLKLYADPDFDGQVVHYPPYGRNTFMTAAESKHVRAMYAALVTMTDRWVGRILDTLERTGRLDDTMVVHITDHGHLFGEHDLEGKPGGQFGNLYETITRVPMLIRHPGGAGAGSRVQGLVQPVDVLPTVLDFLGVDPPDNVHGHSLWPLVRGDVEDVRDHVVSGRFPAVLEGETRQPGVGHLFDGWVGSDRVVEALTVTERDWAMICSPRGRASELYDLEADPDQLDNVIDQHPDRAETMYAKAVAALRDGGASAARLRPFLEQMPDTPVVASEPLWGFKDDEGKTITFMSEAEAVGMGRDPDGVPNRSIFKTSMGDLLADNPRNLVFTHGQYYWAEDLA